MNNNNIDKKLFEEMPIAQSVRKMMLPTIIGSLVVVLYSLADTFFVGLLNDELQSSAVTLAAPALLAFNAVNNLFGVGSSSMMSRALGRGDTVTVKKSASFGFYGSLLCGILISVICSILFYPLLDLLGANQATLAPTAEYMKWAVICGAAPGILNVVMAYLVRSEGASLHASVGTMSGCLLNIILDPFFILPWGLNMGAAGAGLATFLSNCFACTYFFIMLAYRRKKTNISLHPKYISLDLNIVRGVFGVGVPAAIQNLLNVTSLTILNLFVAGYNNDSAIAAIGIAKKINMVPLQIALGGTQGIMPLIGYSYSSKNAKRFEDAIKIVIKMMLPAMLLVSLASWIFAPQLIRLFIEKEEIVAFGVIFLRGFCLSIPFLLLDFLAVGVFQSLGMGKRALLFAVLRKIVMEIPAIILLNYAFGLNGIAYGEFVAEVVLAAAGMIMLGCILRRVKKDQLQMPQK